MRSHYGPLEKTKGADPLLGPLGLQFDSFVLKTNESGGMTRMRADIHNYESHDETLREPADLDTLENFVATLLPQYDIKTLIFLGKLHWQYLRQIADNFAYNE